ncbi:MAG: hypothetical protein LAT56_04835 [Wenzhouxiangella sp.]|nr:hypothetical protein [Wenzhouxiangella sp.]
MAENRRTTAAAEPPVSAGCQRAGRTARFAGPIREQLAAGIKQAATTAAQAMPAHTGSGPDPGRSTAAANGGIADEINVCDFDGAI